MKTIKLLALPALCALSLMTLVVLRPAARPEAPTKGICFHGCNEYDLKPVKPAGFCFPPGSHCRADQ